MSGQQHGSMTMAMTMMHDMRSMRDADGDNAWHNYDNLVT